MKQSRDKKQFFQNKKTGSLHNQQDREMEKRQHIKRSGRYVQLADVEQFSGSFQYLHQRPARKEVRKVIQEITKNRPFEPGIRDYNNLPETTFDDVINAIEIAKERISKKVK